jgi:hypothetical protein
MVIILTFSVKLFMSLTQTAYTSRRIIKYGGIGIIAFSLLWGISKAAYLAYITAHPPYVAPTVKFGLLPRLIFPEKETQAKSFTFELPNDAVPTFKDQTKVYVIYRPDKTLLALEEDKKTAASFGFTDEPIETETGIYKFSNTADNKTLTVNVLTGDFIVTYPYASDQLLANPEKMPSKATAIETASYFLQKGGKYTDDLANGEKVVTFWKIEGDGLKSVSSQSEANAARVDFYRQNLNDLPILSTNFGQASVSVLVSGSTVDAKKIIGVNFKDMSITKESFSTYPIKTGQQVIDSLNSGNYWVAKDVSSKNVTIRKIYLAYFEPMTLTNYLQPIFVVEGDNDFVAYIPAISSDYIKQESDLKPTAAPAAATSSATTN